ncbi:MAG: excinuclease ABC subunit UvrA, partial [Verrucomicrobia bacterium]|nr:excinuclease ABC subunit UvrA [Verrucomicrobiota bacterium]
DMDFLEDSWVDCPVCHGMRFDAETLEVRYKDKNIQDVLEMDVKEAKEHFANIPHLQKKLEMLERVGLDYLKIGQASTTLSGGEAQRIKLVRELSRPDTGKTLYILDEPTTGLHFHDMNHLVEVLQELVTKGNTVVVIEHNIDLIRTCDWIIEMGPESGDSGGKIMATGTPEEIAKTSSATGQILKKQAPKKQKLAPALPESSQITVVGAEQNNLKNITAVIPRGKMTICAGPSGSGKSSFAFETVFAEGQRRYVDSLSPYIRQFVKQMPKPKLQHIDGLSPSVAIEQRLHAANPRSTVGTMTEVYDYLRILYARIGIPHDPKTGARIQAISKDLVVERILNYPAQSKLHILAPIEVRRSDNFVDLLERLQKQGFMRIRLNGTFYELGQDEVPYDSKRKNELFLVVDRLVVDPSMKHRLYEAISTASQIGKQKLWVVCDGQDHFFNLAFAVEETGESYPEITPQTFAFNSQTGMCPDCQGLGFLWGVDFTELPQVAKMTPLELVRLLWGEEQSLSLLHKFGIDEYTPIKELSSEQLALFMNGSSKQITIEPNVRFSWRGINNALAMMLNLYGDEPPLPDEWQAALRENECASCKGARINQLARHVTIDKKAISDLTAMSIKKALAFISTIKVDKKDLTLQQVYDEIKSRLTFLDSIGLSYLQLSRMASTLSGGEAERVRLARQIGSGLTGLLYVLDEPTIGLHPQDVERLISALDQLKALGNTLLVVEHDPQLIEQADHVLEFGPGSGKLGGHIVSTGAPKPTPFNYKKPKPKAPSGYITVKDASLHNLKNVNLEIPLGNFTCLTGVSGSGKSSLLEGVLLEAARNPKKHNKHFTVSGIEECKNLVWMDQRPIGHTTRSDVATFTDVLTPIRHFFASLPEAKIKGMQPKNFSTYHRKGFCTHCWGFGYKKIEMHFLPSVKVPCPQCKGMRLNPLALSITYQGKNIGQILQLSVDEARELFTNHPKIARMLDVLKQVGLGYLPLGQEIQTLSGGETQRMKLVRELMKQPRGKCLYLFDEPTTGLHPREIGMLLDCVFSLTAKGHTVVAIEHNLDFISASDHIVDLGPGAGDEGGQILATGTVQEIMKSKKSITGKFLKNR